MGTWFRVYAVPMLGASALLLGARDMAATPSRTHRIQAVLLWTALSAATGLISWTMLACTAGSLLEGQGWPKPGGTRGMLPAISVLHRFRHSAASSLLADAA